jgi:hydrogenase expression/formation protein HypC
MCLAIPATILKLQDNNMAEVDMMGVTRSVSLDMIEDPKPGEWVLVHAGFAIEKVDEDYAAETIEMINQIDWHSTGSSEPSEKFLEIQAQAQQEE